MTFEYHVEKIKKYVTENTEYGAYQAILAKCDVSEIERYLNDLKDKVNNEQLKEHIFNYISDGLVYAGELSEELSKTSQNADTITSLIGRIEERYREAKRLIDLKG